MSRLAPLPPIRKPRKWSRGSRVRAYSTGYRGKPAVDVDGLVDILHRVGRLAEDMPEVAELDCNPVIATPQGALVIDARIRIDTESARSAVDDTRHLR